MNQPAAEELLAAGVPPEAIVLGLHPPTCENTPILPWRKINFQLFDQRRLARL
jgi:hypothetical protein